MCRAPRRPPSPLAQVHLYSSVVTRLPQVPPVEQSLLGTVGKVFDRKAGRKSGWYLGVDGQEASEASGSEFPDSAAAWPSYV